MVSLLRDAKKRKNYAGAARRGLEDFKLTAQSPDLHFDSQNNLPSQPCTSIIPTRGRILPSEIFKALKDGDIDASGIGYLQRMPAVNSSAKGKTPGPDGLLSEFFIKLN